MGGHMSSGPSVCIPMDVSIELEGIERGGGVKGTKTCISCEFHGLGGRLGARGYICRGLRAVRRVRGLICSVTTLLSALSLLRNVVGLGFEQVLALVDTMVQVFAE